MTEGTRPGRTIVVGVDASPAAGTALRWAIEYARVSGAEVVAVHAFEAPHFFAYPYGDTSWDALDVTLRDGVRRCFEEDWCAPLAGAGVRHREVMVDGPAARVLLDVADHEEADLVVTGRRGLNTLGELVLGSVSHNLVHASPRPVVLVPAAEPVATDVERRDG
jgi:nucleotide-binding universal stress UspA family protein